ncbi:MAG: M1 family metallopeptidase [Deferribacteres bacterium]|nr:M1 family metallopeptidase [candidate division KSB1 bacterium]MCB9500969.1 M1 family metallopeptidase [Deferribacteres bacterium]
MLQFKSITAKINRYILLIFLLVGLITCSTQKKHFDIPKDPHSWSNPQDVKVQHLDIDLNVDFESKKLSGRARLNINNIAGTDTLILDTSDLQIERITLGTNEDETTWRLGENDEYKGAALFIAIKKSTKQVNIYYSTTTAKAVQWLQPEQTAGKKLPFLFTQNQPVFARTWIPCQDSPGVRMTYSAEIRVPRELMAIMSAENVKAKNKDGVYHFNMPQAIPSYLIALAVGDIGFQAISDRAGVYAEPSVLPAAAKEFEDTEKMIVAAEKLYGPYRWDRYDIIVLPPSFPFGGMENPRLTFATPTVIAGDKSLVSLVAHELAHSWSGNLVTNSTWEDIWLNEGFTTYFEHRIMEEIYGYDYKEMLAKLDYDNVLQTIEQMGKDNKRTALRQNLTGDDPDNTPTAIIYDKGHLFLRTMENLVGREKWDTFLKNYFNTFAFQTMSSEKFYNYCQENLIKGDTELATKLQLHDWIYQPGLPANHVVVESPALQEVKNQVEAFKNGTPAADLKTNGWTTHHWRYFIKNLPEKLPSKKLADLDATFAFSQTKNSEVLFSWLMLSIQNRYYPSYIALEEFLTSVGRIKFVAPLYWSLASTKEGKAMAQRIYSDARAGYHPLTTSTIDRILDWQDK